MQEMKTVRVLIVLMYWLTASPVRTSFEQTNETSPFAG